MVKLLICFSESYSSTDKKNKQKSLLDLSPPLMFESQMAPRGDFLNTLFPALSYSCLLEATIGAGKLNG
jgi:hypothetical protein